MPRYSGAPVFGALMALAVVAIGSGGGGRAVMVGSGSVAVAAEGGNIERRYIYSRF